jgi:hypothetical protein
VARSTPSLLSLLGESSCYSGGAHCNYEFQTLNFWRREGGVEKLRLGRLFRPGSPWREALSKRVIAGLRKAGASAVVDGVVTRLSEDDLSNWTLSDRALEVRFAPYAMGCFAEGSFVVEVPLEELKELADEAGPLGGTAGH